MAGRPQSALRSLSEAEPSPLEPAKPHVRHVLHDAERDWPQTNCYVDLMIELVAMRGFEPEAMLGFTLSQDFEEDQFTFFKPRLADLERLYGLRIEELALYDRLDEHVARQTARGRVVMIEVDSYHLPDTRGVAYRIDHSKTTIGVTEIDLRARRIAYFHNDGYFALHGEDFDAIFGRAGETRDLSELFPYAEFARFDDERARGDLRGHAEQLASEHFARRPRDNPIRAFAARFPALWSVLETRHPGFFHSFAFNTFRQLGANFELLGSHLDWLRRNGELAAESEACRRISADAKAMQFQAARASSRKRAYDPRATLDELAFVYDGLFDRLSAKLR